MLVSDFDFALPPGSIAQRPVPRGTSRLLTLGRTDGSVGHRGFADFPDLLRPGDLLVVNDTRVIPARLYGRDPAGRLTEFLLTRHTGSAPETWECLAKPGRRAKPGVPFDFAGSIRNLYSRTPTSSSLGAGYFSMVCTYSGFGCSAASAAPIGASRTAETRNGTILLTMQLPPTRFIC